MACYHPLGAWMHPQTNGRFRLSFLKGYKAGDEQQLIPPTDSDGKPLQFTCIPCGKCIGCRLDYASAWADRLAVEALDFPSEQRWFVTLTYSDGHLPPAGSAGIHTLFPRDCTLFIKRLRSAFPSESIRYFLSGEYGGKFARPHYHLILFGHSFDDLKYHGKNDQGDPYFISRKLDSLWGLGNCVIAEFSWNTASYVARYVIKKVKGPHAAEHYKSLGVVPEFCRSSRRPGIGFNRFDGSSDSYQLPGGRRARLPKSFIEKLKVSDPEAAEFIIAVRRSIGDLITASRASELDQSLDQYLAGQEQVKLIQSKTLKGGLHK